MKIRKQLNVRVVPELHEATSKIADDLDFTRDEIGEVALATLFGARDSLILAKREKIVQAFKRLKITIPFDYPWPHTDNANLTSRGDSASFAASSDGVVAQLVEHHNGIQGVKVVNASGHQGKPERKSRQKRIAAMARPAAAGGAAAKSSFCE